MRIPPVACVAHQKTETVLIHESQFLREVRGFALGNSTSNPFRGSHSLKRKKLSGERQISYREVIEALQMVRRAGDRRGGYGRQMVICLVNAIIADAMPGGQPPDVVAVPTDAPQPMPPTCDAATEELQWLRAGSELHSTLLECSSDGIDERERGRLRQLRALEEKEFHDLIVAL